MGGDLLSERAANSPQLQRAYEEHLEQTKHQVDRLKTIFGEPGIPATGKKCVGDGGHHKKEKSYSRKKLIPMYLMQA